MSKMSFLPFKNVVLGYVIFDIPKIVPYLCSRNEGHEHMNNNFTQIKELTFTLDWDLCENKGGKYVEEHKS